MYYQKSKHLWNISKPEKSPPCKQLQPFFTRICLEQKLFCGEKLYLDCSEQNGHLKLLDNLFMLPPIFQNQLELSCSSFLPWGSKLEQREELDPDLSLFSPVTNSCIHSRHIRLSRAQTNIHRQVCASHDSCPSSFETQFMSQTLLLQTHFLWCLLKSSFVLQTGSWFLYPQQRGINGSLSHQRKCK